LRTGSGGGRRAFIVRKIQKSNQIRETIKGNTSHPWICERRAMTGPILPAKSTAFTTIKKVTINNRLTFCPALKTALPDAIFL